MNRLDDTLQFISNAGWADAERILLAGDASNRRYDRLTRADGTTRVFMDAPPEKGEDVRPFVRIAQYLASLGLSAPEIYAEDAQKGFLLIEDLGDRLFARETLTRPDSEEMRYKAACDVLITLHQSTPPALEFYDAKVTVPLAALAFDWYLMGATGDINSQANTQFLKTFHSAIARLDANLDVMIQRDYHAENLIWLPDRQGVARVGLLDFQGAMLGHRAYDLVSILQDARRDVLAGVQTRMLDYFINTSGAEEQEFRAAYALCGAQRNLRILGVFARLCLRDGKSHYVDLIPRVWDHLQTNLAHPALADTKTLVLDALPEPDATVLKTLKEKSGTCAGL